MTGRVENRPRQLSDPPANDVPSERWIGFLNLLLVGFLTIYLICVAWRLRIDYFDSFDILLNAKAIASRHLRDWRAWRSLGLPMLLAPWFAVEREIGSHDFVFRTSHLIAVAFWASLLLICHRLFRLHLSHPSALAATILMAFNPLLIHYAPTAKEDIPATFFTVACFYAYLRASRHQNRIGFVVAGVLAGLAITTRQNLPPLLFGLILAAEIGHAANRPETFGAYVWKFAALFLLPACLFFLSPMIAYPRVGLSSAMTAPGVLLDDIRDHLSQVGQWKEEGIVKNFRFAIEAATLPVIALTIAGMIVGGLCRRPGAFFHLLWLFFFFAVQTLAFKHREARFLFPAFPPICFFAGIALDCLRTWAIKKGPNRRNFILVATYLLLFAAPLAGAVRECRRFCDEIYFDDIEERVSRFAAELAGANSITWIGPYYPLHPRDYLFDRDDGSTSLYHFGANAVMYFTGRHVREIRVANFSGDDLRQPQRALNGAIDAANDGEVFIINREANDYDSRTLPPQLKPLLICRLRDGALQPEPIAAETRQTP